MMCQWNVVITCFFRRPLKGGSAWWIYEFPNLEMEAMPFLSLLNVKYVLSLGPLAASALACL